MKKEVLNSKADSIWNECLSYIKSKISNQSFETWFMPIKPSNFENNILTIKVPSEFFYEWLEEHYIELLSEVIKNVIGDQGKLAYYIASNKKTLEKEKKIQFTADKQEEKKFYYNKKFDEKYSFKNFIEGDSNRLAKSATEAISKKPGYTAFNPLFIYGNVGLGKTHIINALGLEIQKNFQDKICFYLSSKKFTDQFIASIRNNELQDFINFYTKADLLLIDDIQFLAGKEKTQEMFFHIFNHLHQCNKQIVITSDCPPISLKGLQERLLSRFKWGLTTDIQKPDLETKIAIIENKLNQNNIHITKEIINYIASNVNTNIRDLEGVIVSLIAHISFKKKPVTKDLVKEILINLIQKSDIEINIEFLQSLVSREMNISLREIQGKSRKKEVVIARHIAMYLSKLHTDHSLKSIAEKFGKKNHSTVIHAIQTLDDLFSTEVNVKKQFEHMQNLIKLKTS